MCLGTAGQGLFSVVSVQIPNSSFDISAYGCVWIYTSVRGVKDSDSSYHNCLETVGSGDQH